MLRVNGFYGHIKQHDHRSVFMFAGFMIAFQLVAGVVLALPLFFTGNYNVIFINPVSYLTTWGHWVFLAGTGIFLYRYFAHMQDLRESLGFEVTDRRSEPRIFSIVEPIAITAGIAMPAIAILENRSLNAFACGLDKANATVVVTRGLMQALDDEELAAVIAHEITHIKNGDIALMAVANTALASIKRLEKWNFLKFGKKRSFFLVLMPILIFLLMIINFIMNIGTSIAKISRLVIASSREYIADAEAVRLTHNPAALISALRKIDGRSTIDGLDEIADAMMIDGAVEGAFATHPTIEERIAALAKHAGSMTHHIAKPSKAKAPSIASSVFGMLTKPDAQPVQKSVQSKNLFERVNADASTNIFGISKSAAKYMRVGGIIFIVFIMGSNFLIAHKFKQVSGQLADKQDQASSSEKVRNPKLLEEVTITSKAPIRIDPIYTAAEKKKDTSAKPDKIEFGGDFRGTSD